MRTWKLLIQAGHHCFEKARYDQAMQQYIRACERAEKLFLHWPDAEEAVAITLTSYHNLANCLKCQGRYAIALEVLQKVHYLFDEKLKKPNISSIQREALIRGQRQTLMQLMASRGVESTV